jgi:HisJ family histidinol phosphate phosphatase
VQAKLLRALQNGEIQRLGEDRPRHVDVRVIAASNRQLHDEVREQRFRADLYHRLSAYPVHIPPLRERPDDIAVLTAHFLDLEKYYKTWSEAKKALDDDKNNTLNLCFGIEASYDSSKAAKEAYQRTIAKYPFDVVINSVHCVDGYDVYFKMAFLFKTKKRVYRRYLETILESLDAPYQYDIVAHIGYIAHLPLGESCSRRRD